ncbi:DUF3857 domain-containing protein [Nonlabens ponticola]|nr:DUF3857 domain-containing protein [Nonlabens ponticola]
MNRFLTIGLIIFAGILSVEAQDYEFGEVQLSDFEQTYEDADDIPDAEVLYRKEHIQWTLSDVGLYQYRNVHERILINNESGYDYATKKVRLYNETSKAREKLTKLKGRTYNIVDGEIEEQKLRSDNEFERDISENWKEESFTMPGVRAGSIIEYSYSIRSPFGSIDDVIIQYDIPIRKLDINVGLPKYYIYEVQFNPYAVYVPKIAGEDQESWRRSSGGASQYELSDRSLILDTENIPALKDEPMTKNLENYRSKIIIERAGNRFPGEPIQMFSSTWEQVAKSIYKLEKFGGELRKSRFFKDDLEVIEQKYTGNVEKLAAILDHVQSTVKWNNYVGVTAQNGIKDAYKSGSGNVADINLLLVSMLREAGYSANPVLVSSRDNGIPLFPTRNGFNYVIAHVDMDGKNILLDATDVNTGINSLPLRAVNWQGRLIQKNGNSQPISLELGIFSKEISMVNVDFNEDMTLTGTLKKRYTDYTAYRFRDRYRGHVDSDIIKYIEGDTRGFKIDSLEVENMNKPGKPLNVSCNVTYENAVEQIGDKIYLTPLLHEALSENPFKLESRTLPIDLVYPQQTNVIINVNIPEGYEIASMPDNTQYNFNNGIASYKMVAQETNNRISINAQFTMTQNNVLPKDYSSWREFFSAIVDKDAEKIVLKKVS